MNLFEQKLYEAIDGKSYQVASKIMALIFAIDEGSPFYAFFMKYHKANASGIRQYYEEYACDFENMFDDIDFIHIMFIHPMLLFWKEKYFKRKIISITRKNSPNTGSKKINKLFVNAVSEFIDDSSVDSGAFRVKSKGTIQKMIKSRVQKISNSDDEQIIEFFNKVCPIDEKVSKLIDFEIMLKKDFKGEILEEGLTDFFAKTKTKIGNYIKRKIGGNSLGQIVFRVADRLGLNFNIIKNLVNSLNTKKGLTSDKQNARRGTANPNKIASIVTRGLGQEMYSATATVDKMEAIFTNTSASKITNLYIKSMFDNDNFLNLIYRGVYNDVKAIIKDVESENKNSDRVSSRIQSKRRK